MPNTSLNRVELIGRITQPEGVEFTDDTDTAVGRKIEFRLVTRRSIKGKNGYETKESWHNVSIYTERQIARFQRLGITRGDLVHVSGTIEYFEDPESKAQKVSIAVSSSDILNVYAAKKRAVTEEQEAAPASDEPAHDASHTDIKESV